MLVILFGSTVGMGKWSRQYFLDHGFEFIQKYNYIPEDFALIARYEKRRGGFQSRGVKVRFHI